MPRGIELSVRRVSQLSTHAAPCTRLRPRPFTSLRFLRSHIQSSLKPTCSTVPFTRFETPVRHLAKLHTSGPSTKDPKPSQVNYRSPQNSLSDDSELHESPYTIPNALTVARIIACPFLGYSIVHGHFAWATGILFFGGISDALDGWIARKWNVKSVLGSILDPAADKALMTTLVGTLAWSGMIPVPLAILIFGRDLALSLSAFYFRWISLPRPRTWKRYFDPTIPSAEVKPTQISKVNTALQLILMGSTLLDPLIDMPMTQVLQLLQWTVAATTIWSGFSYLGKSGVRILGKSPTKR